MPSPPNAMTTFTEPMMVHATDLNPFTLNINYLYNNQLVSGFFSRYTMSNNVASTAWTVATPSLAEGTGLGLSLGGSLFTLTAGIWEVNWSLRLPGAVTTNLVLAISSDAAATDTNQLIISTFTSQTGVAAGSIGTNVRSTGSATVGFKIFLPSATGAGAPALSRITFMKEASS